MCTGRRGKSQCASMRGGSAAQVRSGQSEQCHAPTVVALSFSSGM